MLYTFANCVLDTDNHSFSQGGAAVSIEPQVFDLLRLFVENAGKLVTKDRMIEEVWDGRIVSESAISARINAARTAVGDTGKAQAVIRTIPRRGFELVAPVEIGDMEASTSFSPAQDSRQTIRYTTSDDGTQLAYAISGSGPKIMRAQHFLTHLEKDWHSPIWRPYLDALGINHTVVRYDQRSTGLSGSNLGDLNLESYAADLLAVADAAEMERFPLVASSQGVPIAIHFAAHHPERVSHLILYGGFAQGRAKRDSTFHKDEANALLTMIQAGWGNPESAFMVAFTSFFCPDASKVELDNLVEIQLASATPENAARIRIANDNMYVVDLLKKVKAPTLVIHASNDSLHPVSQGRLIAANIPGAEFLQVESNNHIYLPSDPAWQKIVTAQLEFMDRKTTEL